MMKNQDELSRAQTESAGVPQLAFSKNWTDPNDFKTYEPDEAQVRADIQLLHDETKDYINEKLIPVVEGISDEQRFTQPEGEWEAYADAMAYNVASYFCNMAPDATDCVVGTPARETPFVPIYKDKEATLYTNLLRYDAVVDNQSTFGHWAPEVESTPAPEPETGPDTNPEADAESGAESDDDRETETDPESGSGSAEPDNGVWVPTVDGNHDAITVKDGTTYPIMYMSCSNLLMLLTKNRAYEHSPWHRLYNDAKVTPRELTPLCLENGDTNESPWTFDALNVALSWRIAEVMRSSGCSPFVVTSKSESGVITWNLVDLGKLRDGDIMFAGKPNSSVEKYKKRYNGIYHCMMYFSSLDRLNAAAKKWGADVSLRGFDEAPQLDAPDGMGFSGKYGYVVHCGGGTDNAETNGYKVKIKNVIRIETLDRFMHNTGDGVTVWGVRVASNALNSTKLHQGVTGRMMLYDCVLVSSYRHNRPDGEANTLSYQYVESMRSGKDKNNGVFSRGQYRYTQTKGPFTTEEVDGVKVRTLDFDHFIGSKKAGTYCIWNTNINLIHGPTEGNMFEGCRPMTNPTSIYFTLEVIDVSIDPSYCVQRVSTLYASHPRVYQRVINGKGETSKWTELCDVRRVNELIKEAGVGGNTGGGSSGGSTGGGTGISAAAAQLLINILSAATFVSDQSANIQRLGELLNSSGSPPDEPDTPDTPTTQKLSTPVIRLETVSDGGGEDPGDTGDNTPAILGRAVLGRTILGVTDGVDIPKLAKPVIRLETEADPDAPTLPKLETPVIALETVADPEPEPDPEPEMEKLATPEIQLKVEEEALPKLSKPVIRFDYTVDGEDF